MSLYTNTNRISGLVSGMDTESMIKQLMRAESTQYDKMIKKQTWKTWQQESYRSTISSMQSFQNKWISGTSPTNLRYESSFNKYTSTVKDATGANSSAITINTVSSNAKHEIEVTQLAKKDSYISKGLNGNIIGTTTVDSIAAEIDIDKPLKINLTVDGVTKAITVTKADLIAQTSGATDGDKLVNTLNSKVDSIFGKNNDGTSKVEFGKDTTTTGGAAATNNLTVKNGRGNSASISKNDDSKVSFEKMGLVSGININKTLSSKLTDVLGKDFETMLAANIDNAVKLNLGGSEISVTSDDTIATLINKVNNSGSNIELSFNSTTEKFTISSKDSGVVNKLNITDSVSTDFLNLFGDGFGTDDVKLAVDGGSYTAGQDSVVRVDGVELTRSSNTISVDGFKFTAEAVTTGPITIKSETDVDSVFDMIKSFVTDYNSLIEDVNKKVSETRAKSDSRTYYEPLTEQEKESMTDKQIENWEAKAKTGLLNRDSDLNNMLSNLRNVLYSSVETSGGKIALFDIGITTSTNYSEAGKLVIDEKKLKEAIQNNGDQIKEMFTKTDVGIAEKVEGIFKKNIGSIGVLREKAGIKGTASESNNALTRELNKLASKITYEKAKLQKRETAYYKKFSAMETALNKSNNQLSALLSALGQS